MDEDLDRALQADLDGVELFSEDEDDAPDTSAALAALVLPPLVPLEQLIAAAEAEAAAASSSGSGGGRSDGRGRDARGGGSSSLLDELQAALELTGARACNGFAADVSEMSALTASVILPG